MKKRNEMIRLSNEIDHALEDALENHDIDVGCDSLSDKESEAWELLMGKLNTMRSMVLAHVKE